MINDRAKALIGKTVTFSLQPYHSGTGKIIDAMLNEPDSFRQVENYRLTLEVIEGKTVNRLFQHTSVTPMAHDTIDVPRAYPRDIEAGHVTYVYPV